MVSAVAHRRSYRLWLFGSASPPYVYPYRATEIEVHSGELGTAPLKGVENVTSIERWCLGRVFSRNGLWFSRRIRFNPSFLWGSGKYGALVAVRPIGFVYFVAGLEIGIALIGAIVFLGLHAWHGWGQRLLDQSKHGT